MRQLRAIEMATTMLLALVPFQVGSAEGTIVAQCGPANGHGHLRSAPHNPPDLCLTGIPSQVRGNGPWTWQCRIPNGDEATCFAAPRALKVIHYAPYRSGVTRINRQLLVARNLFENSGKRDTTVVLKFAKGVFDFSKDGHGQTIYCDPPGSCGGIPVLDLSDIEPGSNGRLLLLGAGPNQTQFIVGPDQIQFLGRQSRRITIAGINLRQDRLEASQGIQVSTSVRTPDGTPNWVGIDIFPGFPQMQPYPLGLWTSETGPGGGHYLRRYLEHPSCTIDAAMRQYSYREVFHDPGIPDRWWFHLERENPFNPDGGNLIGIKAKSGAGQAYVFSASNDIIFDDVRWTRRSRGVFLHGTINVQIFDSQIVPDPPILGVPVCMASSGGGPQFGLPDDPPTWGNVIDNFTAVNTGDDSIAIFNGHGPSGQAGFSIHGVAIRSSFARSINLFKTPYDVPSSYDLPYGIDHWTLRHLSDCNPARPLTSPPHEPSVKDSESDIGFSECILYQ
jgi:hypothetical protein